MKFLIAGLGSIGRRHLRNLLALGQNDIVLYRTNKSTLPDEELAGFPVEYSLEKALGHHPDAVIVSNPTHLHVKTAVPAAEAGCDLFLEKPIAFRIDELSALEKVISGGDITFFSAFQFRFNPGLKKIKQFLDTREIGLPLSYHCYWGEYLPDWHPWEDFRDSYAAREDMGGGVVLTLCHPLDYLGWLFGEVRTLFAVTGNSGQLDIEVEDFAEVILEHRNGVAGNLHLDYYRRPKRHDLEITCTEGVIGWDYKDSSVWMDRKGKDRTVIEAPDGYERNWMFLEEMKHFIRVVKREEPSSCTYEDGKKALNLAWGILHSGIYRKPVVFHQTIHEGKESYE